MHPIETINEILQELNSGYYVFNESENSFQIPNRSCSHHQGVKNLINLVFLLDEKKMTYTVIDEYTVKLI